MVRHKLQVKEKGESKWLFEDLVNSRDLETYLGSLSDRLKGIVYENESPDDEFTVLGFIRIEE